LQAEMRAGQRALAQLGERSLLLSWIIFHTFTNFPAVKLEPQQDGSARWEISHSPVYVTITVSPQGQIRLHFTEPPNFILLGEDYVTYLARCLLEAARRIEFIDET